MEYTIESIEFGRSPGAYGTFQEGSELGLWRYKFIAGGRFVQTSPSLKRSNGTGSAFNAPQWEKVGEYLVSPRGPDNAARICRLAEGKLRNARENGAMVPTDL
jgi:hypothetical protein